MWRRWLALLVIGAALIALLWWIETAYTPLHSNHEHYYSNRTGYKQNPGDDLLYALGVVFRTVVDAIESHHDLWLVLETLILALFTGTLWWSTRRLWQVSQRHAEHMERSVQIARRSVRAAQASADAAKRSAESLPALERAYLDLEVNPQTANITAMHIKNPIITFRFANYGKTPAILKHFSVVFSVSRERPEMQDAEIIPYDDFMIGSDSLYPEPSITRIGGGSDATVTTTHGLRVNMRTPPTEDELSAIQRGEAFIWFMGKVVYRDVFSRDDRTTAFCYSYSGIEGESRRFVRNGGETYTYRT